MEIINDIIEKTRANIIKNLQFSEWDNENGLYHYWRSEPFKQVIESLYKLVEDKKRFVPEVHEIFKFLEACKFSDIRAVFVIDTVMHNGLWYHGIPYSNDATIMKVDPITEHPQGINKELKKILSPITKKMVPFDYKLERWSKEGVLLMAHSPTIRLQGQPHYNLWKDWRARIIEAIELEHPDIPWLFIGWESNMTEMMSLIRSEKKLTIAYGKSLEYPEWYTWVDNNITGNSINWK